MAAGGWFWSAGDIYLCTCLGQERQLSPLLLLTKTLTPHCDCSTLGASWFHYTLKAPPSLGTSPCTLRGQQTSSSQQTAFSLRPAVQNFPPQNISSLCLPPGFLYKVCSQGERSVTAGFPVPSCTDVWDVEHPQIQPVTCLVYELGMLQLKKGQV